MEVLGGPRGPRGRRADIQSLGIPAWFRMDDYGKQLRLRSELLDRAGRVAAERLGRLDGGNGAWAL